MNKPTIEPILINDIPEDSKLFPCWVLMKWEEVNGVWKQKFYQPKYPTLKAHKGQPKDWSTFETAWKVYSVGGFDGFEFFDEPTTLKIKPENIPNELKTHSNWVLWKWMLTEEMGEMVWKKIPFQVKNPGNQAASTRPEEWTDFDTAYIVYQGGGWAGMWFSLNKLYVGVDFDHVIDTNPERLAIIREALIRFDSFTEISPSGTGMHCLVEGDLLPGYGFKNKDNDFEIYKDARFLSVTGHILSKTKTIESRQDAINWFHSTYFKQRPIFKPIASNGTARMSNEEIITKILTSKTGEKFKKLYMFGDYSDFLDTTGKPDESSADYYFCASIAFYTSDPAQIYAIVLKSRIMREKWNRMDYADRTIRNVLGTTTRRYRAKRQRK